MIDNNKILNKVTKGETSTYVMAHQNKAELVRLANFLRSHGFKCKISPFGFTVAALYQIVITRNES